jgi:hypothetical protein
MMNASGTSCINAQRERWIVYLFLRASAFAVGAVGCVMCGVVIGQG